MNENVIVTTCQQHWSIQNFSAKKKKCFEYPKIVFFFVYHRILCNPSRFGHWWFMIITKKAAMIQEKYAIWFKVFFALNIMKKKEVERTTLQHCSMFCLESKVSFHFCFTEMRINEMISVRFVFCFL